MASDGGVSLRPGGGSSVLGGSVGASKAVGFAAFATGSKPKHVSASALTAQASAAPSATAAPSDVYTADFCPPDGTITYPRERLLQFRDVCTAFVDRTLLLPRPGLIALIAIFCLLPSGCSSSVKIVQSHVSMLEHQSIINGDVCAATMVQVCTSLPDELSNSDIEIVLNQRNREALERGCVHLCIQERYMFDDGRFQRHLFALVVLHSGS